MQGEARRTSHGAVRVHLASAGRIVAGGQAVARSSSATVVALRGKVRRGQRNTLATSLSAGPHTRTTVMTRIVVGALAVGRPWLPAPGEP